MRRCRRMLFVLLSIVLLSYSTAADMVAQSPPPDWEQVTWEGVAISFPSQYDFDTMVPPIPTARVTAGLQDPQDPNFDRRFPVLVFTLESTDGLDPRAWALRRERNRRSELDVRDVQIGNRQGITYEICIGDGCNIVNAVPLGNEMFVLETFSVRGALRVQTLPEILRLLAFPLDEQCFSQTQQCLSGRFQSFWEQHGGLPVFGYPISTTTDEQTREGTFPTQWFERNRFELHGKNTAPYDYCSDA